MQKIPTVFERDEATNRRTVTREVVPGCEWVFAGEGVPTRKYDGACAMFRGSQLFRRHEVRAGKQTPPDFEPVETDSVTGNVVGWVPVGPGSEDKWFVEAWGHLSSSQIADGTYELVGPKVQGNPEHYDAHTLIAHDTAEVLADAPRDFDGLRDWLLAHEYEGIVWHHPDGRMAKIKRRDFVMPKSSSK